MKLIIDIPEERLYSIKRFGIKQNEVCMLERALISGTPLDDVKAEIGKAWYSKPNTKYDKGRKDQALEDMKILDKHRGGDK